MFNPRTITLAALLAAATVGLAVTPLASAKGGDGVRVRGTCSQASHATLKAGREDSGTEIELEVDQNRNAVPWKVTLQRNGSTVFLGRATTKAPSGSFELRRVIAGRGTIVAQATSPSGERCSARLTI
jgi:hypothetical protein